jgi:hypothetical protein
MVDRRELRWCGHLIKMVGNRKPRQVWETRIEGTQGRGSPRIDWEEHMQKLTSKKGRMLQEVTRLVKDRKAFWIWLMQPNT